MAINIFLIIILNLVNLIFIDIKSKILFICFYHIKSINFSKFLNIVIKLRVERLRLKIINFFF
jgi:hypothetical protein